MNSLDHAKELIKHCDSGGHCSAREAVDALRALLVHIAIHTEHKRDDDDEPRV